MINKIKTDTDVVWNFSNSFKFKCDNVIDQYFPSTCEFGASKSVASWVCHDYATNYNSTTYLWGYGDVNDCGLWWHHDLSWDTNQVSSYGWHTCWSTDATYEGYAEFETKSNKTGCWHNYDNSWSAAWTLWVR